MSLLSLPNNVLIAPSSKVDYFEDDCKADPWIFKTTNLVNERRGSPPCSLPLWHLLFVLVTSKVSSIFFPRRRALPYEMQLQSREPFKWALSYLQLEESPFPLTFDRLLTRFLKFWNI